MIVQSTSGAVLAECRPSSHHPCQGTGWQQEDINITTGMIICQWFYLPEAANIPTKTAVHSFLTVYGIVCNVFQ